MLRIHIYLHFMASKYDTPCSPTLDVGLRIHGIHLPPLFARHIAMSAYDTWSIDKSITSSNNISMHTLKSPMLFQIDLQSVIRRIIKQLFCTGFILIFIELFTLYLRNIRIAQWGTRLHHSHFLHVR